MRSRKRMSLMPAVALAALSALVAVPTLSMGRLHAAPVTRYASVTVHAGDTLWSIAAKHMAGGSIQERIDEIVRVNHLRGASLLPGEHIRVPE